MIKYTGDLRCDFEKATAEITKLKDRIVGYQEQTASLRASVKSLKQSNDFHKKNYQESLAEKDAIIKELQNRLAHAEALLNHDGSNTGTPTSQTPINKNKVIPNSRRSSGRKKGGQPGHPKAALEARRNLRSQIPSGTHYRTMNAVQNAGLQTASQPASPKLNLNTMYALKSLRSNTNSFITNAATAALYSGHRYPQTSRRRFSMAADCRLLLYHSQIPSMLL